MEVAVLHDIGADRNRILAALRDGQGDTGRKGAERKPLSAIAAASVTCQPGKMTIEEFLAAVDMLTPTQRSFCDHVMQAVEHQGKQFFLVLSGGAGVGKSVTLRCITQDHYQELRQAAGVCGHGQGPGHVRAFTAKAAFNVAGDTFHATLGIGRDNVHMGMSDSSKATKQCDYAHVQVIIIDEISLTSADMLHTMQIRCTEVFWDEASCAIWRQACAGRRGPVPAAARQR